MPCHASGTANGRLRGVAPILSGGEDPLFLQIKEARRSVLERHLPRCTYANHGPHVAVAARFLEDLVIDAVAANPAIRYLILEYPAVNTIDSSALESLEAINHRPKDGGITFHRSDVKGPVMDQLKRSRFLQEPSGKVHLSEFDAVSSIKPDLPRQTAQALSPGDRWRHRSAPAAMSMSQRGHERRPLTMWSGEVCRPCRAVANVYTERFESGISCSEPGLHSLF